MSIPIEAAGLAGIPRLPEERMGRAITRTLKLPVRVDLIGGWSDQAFFRRPAAVLNAAVGWDGQYPLSLTGDGVTSLVEGVGTGLGISSILDAGRAIQEDPLSVDGRPYQRAAISYEGTYIQTVLRHERKAGTCGGWQDQIGGIEPGFKLIETDDQRVFHISRNDAHPLFQHLVLFDTGTRRNSGVIGHKVRALLRSRGHFRDSLSEIVRIAQAVFASSDPRWCIDQCLAAWRILVGYVPEMQGPPVPMNGACVGYKLVGAGGGGYGLMFVREPEDREAACRFLEERGLWARVPELLEGARWE